MPVAVKLSPYFSSTANMAKRLVDEGANGLVLFNRFYQPDIDPDTLAVVPQVGLSSPAEARLQQSREETVRRTPGVLEEVLERPRPGDSDRQDGAVVGERT